jgi:hypothetical protein
MDLYIATVEELKAKAFDAMPHGHGQTFNVERAAKIIEAALAEREAQVRAEEREAAKGLVEALEDALRDMPTVKKSEHFTPVLNWVGLMQGRFSAVMATYNDNRKG